MAENRVQIVITADNRGAVTGIRQTDGEIRKLADGAQYVNRSFQSLGRTMTLVTAAIAAMGAAGMFKGFIDTAARFEQVELSLTTLMGSSEKAKEAMGWITDFTARTPYELNQVAEAFIRLAAVGLDPVKSLRMLGDTAGAMGKTLMQAVEMYVDAITGEYERMKEFGVRAAQEGERVAFHYSAAGKDMVVVANKTQESVSAALEQIFSRFAGGMERQASSWKGLMSNLSDSWTLFQKEVMDSEGLFLVMKAGVTAFYEEIKRLKDEGKIKEWARDMALTVVQCFRYMNDAAFLFRTTINNLQAIWAGLRITFAEKELEWVQRIGKRHPSKENVREQERLVEELYGKNGLYAVLRGIKEDEDKAIAQFDAAEAAITRLGAAASNAAGPAAQAGSGLNDFSNSAGQAASNAAYLEQQLKSLNRQFKEIEAHGGKIGADLDKWILESTEKLKAAATGLEPGRAAIEISYRSRLAEIEKWRTEMKKAGMGPGEIEAYISPDRAKLAQAHDLAVKAHGAEAVRKTTARGGAAGASPIDIDKIDKDVLQFTERMQKLYSELEDLDSEYRIARLEQSGRYYDAEAERLDRQAAKRKESFAKEVADTEQAYLEMEQKLSGGRGGTAEAWAQLAELKSKWDAAKKAAQEYGDKIDRNLQLTKDVKKAEDDAKRAEDLAQLNLEYGKLTGTLQEQLALQILLLRAEKDRKLLAADPALRAAVERNYAAMERELEIERSGSFWDNFFLAAEKYRKTIPAIGQMGKSAFETLVRGIESAADALAQFTMTGEMDFENFSNSILRDILRMQYQALLTQMILGSAGSASGGGGILGWLMDLFKGGGMTTASGRYWDSSMNFYEHHAGGIAGGSGSSIRNAPAWLLAAAPRLHDGLAPDEFPAILQRGERVLSRRETRDYGAASRAPEVVVNVQNKTNTPVTADKTRAAFDGKRYVVDVILDDYSRGGDVWKMIRGNRNG